MIGVILQARMGSERLPGKSVAEIEGKPLLAHILERLKHCRSVKQIIVATTTKKEDDAIAQIAESQGVLAFRGSEADVMDRYYKAAKRFRVDPIIRVTGDCPFVDPQLIDRMVELFKSKKPDYLCNTLNPTFPDGLDVEIFTFKAIEKAWKEATMKSEREHVTPYIRKHPEAFAILEIRNDEDLSGMRWVIDNEEDLVFTREVYRLVYREGRPFTTDDVLAVLKTHLGLLDINRHIKRNAGYEKSLEKDKAHADERQA